MIPADFRVYDALNCCATAVAENLAGRPAKAIAAWTAARDAAAAITDGPVCGALGEIIAASGPSQSPSAALQRALDASALACLIARNGDTDLTALALGEASDFTGKVPQRDAFATVLAAIWDMSREEVAA
jgi:hypothetical protein